MLLTDKVAVVTGAARGLGRSDALVLAEEGADIVLVDIDGQGAQAVAREVEKFERRAMFFAVDITDLKAVEEMGSRVKDRLGGADILVNNAATLDNLSQIENMDDKLWDRDLNVNLTGSYYCTKIFYPQMKEKKWGRIINMASVAGTLGGFGQVSYSATKAGIIGFTKSIALEGARYGITCNAIVGGLLATDISKSMPDKMRDRLLRRVPMAKMGDPEDVANAVAFLASDRAKYITGVALNVTGGLELFAF